MTEATHAAAQVDEAKLAPYLEEHVEGFKGLKGLHKFSDGQSNPTFRVDAESGSYVMRAKPPGELLKSAHQVDREYRVMAALAKTDVPVPRMFHLAPDDERSPLGRQFYIMEFLDGRVLWEAPLPQLPKEERSKIYDEMNKALAALHDVDYEAVGLGDFGRPGTYFQRQYKRWSGQYRASETETIPEMDALMTWLEEHEPADDGIATLVHGDYRLDNVMFHKTEPRLIAVLDWELCTVGHPYADLGYQCANWRMPDGDGFRGLGGHPRDASDGLPDEKAYVEAYCKRRGIPPIDNWEYYIAFSQFRLAAIMQGVYKRGIDGNASNPDKALRAGRSVRPLAAHALKATEKAA